MNKEETGKLKQVRYFTIHYISILAGLLFFAVGILTLLHYDYGLLSFIFAFPQFFLTGLVPMLVALLLFLMAIIEAERVSISSNEETLTVQVSLLRKTTIHYDLSSIKYVGLKYKETKTIRWMIIFALMLITIEVLLQNAIDLLGSARIAPLLIACTILMLIGIVIFVFFPRRFLEIGTSEETIFIPFHNLPRSEMEKLLQILTVNPTLLDRRKSTKKIYGSLISQFPNFILSIFLIALGITLVVTPLFLGAFTRVLVLTLGIKLLTRILNADRFTLLSDGDHLYLGDSFRLTFMKTTATNVAREKSFSPLNSHPLEIICLIYLISQSIRYGFRNLWWAYANFSPLYFSISIILLGLIFIKWFNPITILQVNFQDFSLKIRESSALTSKDEKLLQTLFKNTKQFFLNFKIMRDSKYLGISILLFAAFLIWPIFYNLFGGNFIFI